jgi:hypothetical protein
MFSLRVPLKTSFVREGHLASIAFVRPFVGVHPKMNTQVGAIEELSLAIVARVRAHRVLVHLPNVHPHASFVRVRFDATGYSAGVRFFGGRMMLRRDYTLFD